MRAISISFIINFNAMKFISLSAPENILTDGETACQYHQIPELFAQIQDYFLAKAINHQQAVVLDCDNSLPSALVLLFLLEHGYHFLLSKPENSHLIPPEFCRHQLQISGNSLIPAEFLNIVEHPANQVVLMNNEPQLYMRTSGSTGEPKIIVHSHTLLHGNISMCVQRLGYDQQTRMALPVPISHLFGLGAGFLPAVTVGASIDLQKGANIIRFLQREKEFDPNTVLMTPIFCETLLKGRKTARSYQLTVVAGDRLRAGVFEKYEALFGCLVQLYGSTEMGAIAAGNPKDSSELRAGSVGLPMPDVEVKTDRSTAEITDDNQDSGEIWCKRKYRFVECWDAQAQPIALETVDKTGWFATRDLGRVLGNGYIDVLGRCDHSIKRDGLLVMFADVESALLTLEGVESAAVVARGESLRGRGLWAYCVISAESQLDAQRIRSLCFDCLPKRAVPDQIIILDSLPLLANGKIDRQSLLAMP